MPVLGDSISDYPGPLAGVLAGLDWAAGQGADHIVTAAGDTPFFPQDLVPRLLLAAEVETCPIALAATRENGTTRRHPTFGLWPVGLRDDLRAALGAGMRKVVAWADQHGAANAVFETEPFDPFFNINTASDLETAKDMM